MTITKLQSVDPRVRRCPSASGPLSAAVAATLGLLPAVAAYAQDDEAGVLEEVVVRPDALHSVSPWRTSTISDSAAIGAVCPSTVERGRGSRVGRDGFHR